MSFLRAQGGDESGEFSTDAPDRVTVSPQELAAALGPSSAQPLRSEDFQSLAMIHGLDSRVAGAYSRSKTNCRPAETCRPSSLSRQYSTRWYFTRSDPSKRPQNGNTRSRKRISSAASAP